MRHNATSATPWRIALETCARAASRTKPSPPTHGRGLLVLIVATLAFVVMAPGIAMGAESTQDAVNANANMCNGGTATASGAMLFFYSHYNRTIYRGSLEEGPESLEAMIKLGSDSAAPYAMCLVVQGDYLYYYADDALMRVDATASEPYPERVLTTDDIADFAGDGSEFASISGVWPDEDGITLIAHLRRTGGLSGDFLPCVLRADADGHLLNKQYLPWGSCVFALQGDRTLWYDIDRRSIRSTHLFSSDGDSTWLEGDATWNTHSVAKTIYANGTVYLSLMGKEDTKVLAVREAAQSRTIMTLPRAVYVEHLTCVGGDIVLDVADYRGSNIAFHVFRLDGSGGKTELLARELKGISPGTRMFDVGNGHLLGMTNYSDPGVGDGDYIYTCRTDGSDFTVWINEKNR